MVQSVRLLIIEFLAGEAVNLGIERDRTHRQDASGITTQCGNRSGPNGSPAERAVAESQSGLSRTSNPSASSG